MEVLLLAVIYVIIFYFINNELTYIRKFRRMKLFNGGVSRTLSDIGIKESRQLKKMKDKGIFIQTKENKKRILKSHLLVVNFPEEGINVDATLLQKRPKDRIKQKIQKKK